MNKKVKRISITASVLLLVIALMAFNKVASNRGKASVFVEAQSDAFEISVSSSGELIAERSVDIMGPQMVQGRRRGRNNMRIQDLKIQDIVAEGTIVSKGDYIAQIDRTQYDNSHKDAQEALQKELETLEMRLLDSAVTLTNLRDEIKNQAFAVEEAQITLEQSKYEPPATIRKMEIDLDKQKRTLDQMRRSYQLKAAQSVANIYRQNTRVSMARTTVEDIEHYLSQFTINAPSDGMVIYKKDRRGNKRKTGSTINPWDLAVATLPDLSTMLSRIYINEIEIGRIRKNQKVHIVVDAFPDKKFEGTIMSIANIGEQLPNSDAKMFEVFIRINEMDPALRPSMTTSNKIIIDTFNDVISIPAECVYAGADSIPFVYSKNGRKQIVVLGKANEKNIIIEKGLKEGTQVYIIPPEDPETFEFSGVELIPEIKQKSLSMNNY
jgi:multidrug efflux pump subunit AcrA (membrane-fusion protein)